MVNEDAQVVTQNALEKVLESALLNNNKTEIEDFFTKLTQSQLYLLTDADDEPDDVNATNNDYLAENGVKQVEIMQWYLNYEDGTSFPFIPVFTSKQALNSAILQMQKEGTEYHGQMEWQGRSLLQLTYDGDIGIILNPNTSLSKTIDGNEMNYMLQPNAKLIGQQGHFQILSPVSKHDLPLLNELGSILAKCRTVKKAYLIYSSSFDFMKSGSDHSLYLGLEFTTSDNADDLNRIHSETDKIHSKVELNGCDIKINLISHEDEMSQYFLTNTSAFYQASFLSRVKSWFS